MSSRDPTSLDRLLWDVQAQFEKLDRADDLLAMSKKLQAELQEQLMSGPDSQCMLPSFNYELPTGQEKGIYLALEVGGSNLRTALVELNGRAPAIGHQSMKIRRMMCFSIDIVIRQLNEIAFFDWIAERVKGLLEAEFKDTGLSYGAGPAPIGVAWSFPIEQTSIRSGKVRGMGKGFQFSTYIIGRDLGGIFANAFRRANLAVHVVAIVNDSSAALLARAYLDSTTRLATILGTGMNAAIHLPIAALHPSKFGSRSSPLRAATHVLTNTELSMFGKNIFPTTNWDRTLNAVHIFPDYQPFEYLVAGKYISEIVRLIIVEATSSARLFGGSLPPSLANPYTLDTRNLAFIEFDTTSELAASRAMFDRLYPAKQFASERDMVFIRTVVKSVTSRSILLFTVGIHALTTLLQRLETKDTKQVTIGCEGSIINQYPKYMEKVQASLDHLLRFECLEGKIKIRLERSIDSAVLGAAVAVAMVTRGN